MKNIRKSVFETNSSSTHSICVTKNNILDQRKNSIKFTIGSFGWERSKYSTAHEKAKYLYTGILYNNKEDLIDNIKSILKANNILYDFEAPAYRTTDSGYKYLDYGYIDHGSELIDFLYEVCLDEDKLMRYLFSSESFIITGNDNSDHDVNICVPYSYDEYYKGN